MTEAWTAAPATPVGARVDPQDSDAPVFRAAGDAEGRLSSFESQLCGRACSMLLAPAGVVGPAGAIPLGATSQDGVFAGDKATVEWRPGPFGVEATVTATAPHLSFVATLAGVERSFDATDLTNCLPIQGRELLSLHRWSVVVDEPLLSPDGTSPFEVSLRRVLALRSSVVGHIGRDAIWQVPLPPGQPVDLSITLRWPIVSAPDTYPTHDGQRQWWRVVTPPDMTGEAVPLIVGLHGACNTADNWLAFAHPAWSSSAKVIAAMLLGCPIVVPNANDGPGVEANHSECPEPRLYGPTGERYVFDAIAEATRRFPVDLDRVYLFGLSMGGYGALTIAARNPGRIAAVVAGAPPTDLARIVATFQADDRFGIARYVSEALGEPAENQTEYLSHSALWLADNLLHVAVIVRGSAGDKLVDGPANAGELGRRLAELGYPHDVSITEVGTHGDYDTVEGLHERAMARLLSRPAVNPSPDRVVFKTADLNWRRAYWVEINSLAGEWGMIEAHRNLSSRSIELRLCGVSGATIDLRAAGLQGTSLTLRASADKPCRVALVATGQETIRNVTPGDRRSWSIPSPAPLLEPSPSGIGER